MLGINGTKFLTHSQSKVCPPDAYEDAILHRDKTFGKTPATLVEDLYLKSCELSPSLRNPAWSQLLDIYQETLDVGKEENILDHHLSQNAFSSKTCRVLFKVCKRKKEPTYKEYDLFVFLEEAFAKHYPRNESEHLRVIIDACCEFSVFSVLRKTLERIQLDPRLSKDEDITRLLIGVQYNVFRDLSGAIALGEKYLEERSSTEVREILLELYIDAERYADARECLKLLTGTFSAQREMLLEASILEAEGRFQDAIDTLNDLPDKRNFDEKYMHRIAYLELLLEDYEAAEKRLSKFLNERSFNLDFDIHILNYEFSKLKGKGKNPNKRRLESLKTSQKSPEIRAVATYLLEDKVKAMELLSAECEKRFSKIYDYQSWPILRGINSELTDKRIKLEKAKRSLSTLDN